METSYHLRFPYSLSATSISWFSDCEQRFFYKWIALDVPITPSHVSLVYGSSMHAMAQHIWNQKLRDGKLTPGIVRYCHAFIVGALNGRHGSRSTTEPPQPIRWFSLSEEIRLTKAEKEEALQEKKKEYITKAYFALHAIYLECVAPSPFVRTEIEYSFKRNKIMLPVLDGDMNFPLIGVIDRVHFLLNDEYILKDYKTGLSSFYQRNKLVRDIQMTIYQYAGEWIWGRPPKAMFIQPLEVTKRDLETYGEKTLEHLRISVPVRKDPVHFEGVMNIARDILAIIDFLVYPSRHTKEEKDSWQPVSEWGKMAAFTDNIEQNRFVPRIGTWCGACPYNQTCHRDNPKDWERWGETRENASLGSDVKEEVKTKPEELPAQESFFPEKRRARSYTQSERQIRKSMISSGNFFHAKNVAARLKEMHKILKNGSSPCPCVRLNLISLSFLVLLPQFLADKGKRRIDRKVTERELGEICPYETCPHRK